MILSRKNQHIFVPLQEFTQTKRSKELEELKQKSQKEFDRLIKADWTKLSNGKNLKGFKATFKLLLDYLEQKASSKKVEDLKELTEYKPLLEETIKKLEIYRDLENEGPLSNVMGTKEFKAFKEFFDAKFPEKTEEEIEVEEQSDLEENEEKVGIWDVETVRKDYDYELFFIRRENGAHFFSKDLMKKLRFSIDFSKLMADKMPHDPILSYKEIHDDDLFALAKALVDKNYHKIQWFLQTQWEDEDRFLCLLIRKAIMALLLASHSKNLLSNVPKKTTTYYFFDFQNFFREILVQSQFEELCDPKSQRTIMQKTMVELCQGIASTLYTRDLTSHDQYTVLAELIKITRMHDRTATEPKTQIDRFGIDDTDFNTELEKHAGGPLIKVWDYLNDADSFLPFDSVMQDNHPCNLFDLRFNGDVISCLRLPSPTRQLYIQKVDVVPEFINFLRGMQSKDPTYCHLMINLQNRTSLKEYHRCVALEDLQSSAEFVDLLTVVTLPKNTDFYNQKGEYDALEDPQEFISVFKEQILDGVSYGFFFPPRTQSAINPAFVDRMLHTVHEIFFPKVKKLSTMQRKGFIELAYLILQLKVIEVIHPSSFSLTCKDAIDDGAASSALLYAMLELLHKKDINGHTRKLLDRLVFDFPMMIRERTMIKDDFDRLMTALQLLQKSTSKKKIAGLADLFEIDLMQIKILDTMH